MPASRGCDVVIAVTKDDNTNLMVAQLARDIFGVPKVISRVPIPGGKKYSAALA